MPGDGFNRRLQAYLEGVDFTSEKCANALPAWVTDDTPRVPTTQVPTTQVPTDIPEGRKTVYNKPGQVLPGQVRTINPLLLVHQGDI